MSEPVFPRTGARGHYESYYVRAVDPERAARRLDPPHGAQAPGRGARRLALVHALGR